MNVLDFVIIGLFATLIMVGFFGGIGRVAAGTVAVYFSTLVSAAFYRRIGDSFADAVANLSEPTAHLWAFMVLFIVMTAAFFAAIGATIKAVEIRHGRFAILDNIGGATLAMIAGALAVAMTVSVAVIILGAFNTSAVAGGDGELGELGRQIRSSELVPMFLKLQEPVLIAYKPWFPDGLPPILETPPQPVT